MKCRIESLARSMEGDYLLTLRTRDHEAASLYADLHERDVEASLKAYRPKRSLTANAYAWTLIDRLAEVLRRSKTEVYREAIRDIGGVSEIVCCKNSDAADRLLSHWASKGIGWFGECEPSKLPGCVNVTLYYGSSAYDSRQMAALIDHVVQDCKAVGIETLPPHEIDALNDAWRGA